MLDANLLAPERSRPLRRAEYDKLVALGAFVDERVELLHGVIVEMSPQDPSQAFAMEALTHLLVGKVGRRARVRVQSPFAASDDSEPEPDLAVVPVADYSRQHPKKALLLIEVSVSSQRKDRQIKAAIYAACGVPEFWLVDVKRGLVEVFRDIVDDRYSRVTPYDRRGTIRLRALSQVSLRVSSFLPRAAASSRGRHQRARL